MMSAFVRFEFSSSVTVWCQKPRPYCYLSTDAM